LGGGDCLIVLAPAEKPEQTKNSIRREIDPNYTMLWGRTLALPAFVFGDGVIITAITVSCPL
jgi:hypothetical protein